MPRTKTLSAILTQPAEGGIPSVWIKGTAPNAGPSSRAIKPGHRPVAGTIALARMA